MTNKQKTQLGFRCVVQTLLNIFHHLSIPDPRIEEAFLIRGLCVCVLGFHQKLFLFNIYNLNLEMFWVFDIEFKSSIQKKMILKSRLPRVAETTLTLKDKEEG